MSELKLPELFGSRVFNEETMKERLSGACDQGGGAGLHPLYPLVPADDWLHGGKA